MIYTVLIVLAILILILFLPINFLVVYNNKRDVAEVSFLWFKFGTSNKSNVQAIEKGACHEIDKLKHLKKLWESKNKIFKALNILALCVNVLVHNIKISKMHIIIGVSAGEAFDCSRNFCIIASLVSVLGEKINIKSKVRDLKLVVYPSFISEKTLFDAELKFRFCLAKLLYCVLIIIFRYVRMKQ